jgi:hypothetical protein
MWEGFRVRPHAGRLDVRHWFVNDQVTSITVEAVEAADRRPRAREVWRLNVSDARVLTVRTTEGNVDLAVAAGQVDWLRGQLAGAELPTTD